MRAELRHFAVHLVWICSNLLPSNLIGSVIRVFLLKCLGNDISIRSRVSGGGYVGGSRLRVGGGCYIGRNVYFDLSENVTISSNVVIGHGVTFVTASHSIGPPGRRCGAVLAMPIYVHAGAWIAANVTILPGVTIGEGAVVAAGSLVTKSVEQDMLVAGCPAVPKRKLSTGE